MNDQSESALAEQKVPFSNALCSANVSSAKTEMSVALHGHYHICQGRTC